MNEELKPYPEDFETPDDVFEPILGELVADDSFAFTLLSCHCSH